MTGKRKLLAALEAVYEQRAVTQSPPPFITELPSPDYLSYLRATLPSGWTADPAHIRLIAEHLDAVERGEIDRLAIHMPPRHAKSESVTYRYPLYHLERTPTDNVLVTGYNERFARKFGRRTRNLAKVRGLVAVGKSASDEWETNAGGLYMARGVGSPPTGTGFQRIVVDDPIRRRQDADSETYRESVWDWYTDDLYTRLEPGGAIVLIMTLWQEDDIGARAVASEPGRWTVLKLPAIAGNDDPIGRAPGAALWPERYNLAALARIKGVLLQNEGERSWEALYQQNPTVPEGSFFKPAQIEIVDALPAGLRGCRGWDIAASVGKGDFTSGFQLQTDGAGRYYIADLRRGQWGPDEADAEIKQTAALDGRGVTIRLAQDPGSAGKRDAAALVRMLAGYVVKAEPISGSKEVRARAFASQVNAGNVKMLRASWNAVVIAELRAFPNGRNDDIVDSGSDAFTELTTCGESAKRPAYGMSRLIGAAQ